MLHAVDRHDVSALALAPQRLERIIGLPKQAIARQDTSSLRVIAVNGPALAGELAMPVIDAFTDVLYSLSATTVLQLDGIGSAALLSPPRRSPSSAHPGRARVSAAITRPIEGHGDDPRSLHRETPFKAGLPQPRRADPLIAREGEPERLQLLINEPIGLNRP